MDIKEINKLSETAYSRGVFEKIEQLSGKDKGKFNENFSAILEEDTWLSFHGLDDSNYSEQMVKIILYNEIFGKDFSYLHRD